jgi:hypothetical protein
MGLVWNSSPGEEKNIVEVIPIDLIEPFLSHEDRDIWPIAAWVWTNTRRRHESPRQVSLKTLNSLLARWLEDRNDRAAGVVDYALGCQIGIDRDFWTPKLSKEQVLKVRKGLFSPADNEDIHDHFGMSASFFVAYHARTVCRFTKMHGLGNDFVVLDAVTRTSPHARPRRASSPTATSASAATRSSSSRTARPEADFRYRIFNADGGEVEQCGNGARCFVRFVHEKGLTAKRAIRVETRCGLIEPRLEDDGLVTVDMGVPRFEPSHVPFVAESDALVQPLRVGEETVEITALSMGNPHAVQVVATSTPLRSPNRVR